MAGKLWGSFILKSFNPFIVCTATDIFRPSGIKALERGDTHPNIIHVAWRIEGRNDWIILDRFTKEIIAVITSYGKRRKYINIYAYTESFGRNLTFRIG